MNKKILASLVFGLTIVACNGGGATPIYLPAGTYNTALTNFSSTCQRSSPGSGEQVTSNGTGNLCYSYVDGAGNPVQKCVDLNLANNPCLTRDKTHNINGTNVNVNENLNNCALTSTGMTATLNYAVNATINESAVSCTNTATMTLTQVN